MRKEIVFAIAAAAGGAFMGVGLVGLGLAAALGFVVGRELEDGSEVLELAPDGDDIEEGPASEEIIGEVQDDVDAAEESERQFHDELLESGWGSNWPGGHFNDLVMQ